MENKYIVIANAWGDKEKHKLLFQLAIYDGKVVLLLKRKGDNNMYYITIEELLSSICDYLAY